MKKITLLFTAFLTSSIAMAQFSNVTINTQTPADFRDSLADDTPGTDLAILPEGNTITVGFDYTVQGNEIYARLVGSSVVAGSQGTSLIVGGTGAMPVSGTAASVTFTVPDVTADTPCRIQLFSPGTDGGGNTAFNHFNYIVLDQVTLSNNDFTKSKLNAYYSTDLKAVIVKEQFTGDYSIYNLTGQEVQAGGISNDINVSGLKSGIYILSTEYGSLKFAK